MYFKIIMHKSHDLPLPYLEIYISFNQSIIIIKVNNGTLKHKNVSESEITLLINILSEWGGEVDEISSKYGFWTQDFGMSDVQKNEEKR